MATSKQRVRRSPGEGALFCRADGKWVARLTTGQRRVERVRPTRAAAREALRELKRAAEAGELQQGSNQTLGAHLDTWLRDVVTPSVRDSTAYTYRCSMVAVRAALGDVPLPALTPQAIQRLYAQMREDGLSAQTVRSTHRALRQALSQAVAWQLLRVNPTNDVRVPEATESDRRSLSRDEAARLLAATQHDRLYPLWRLLLTTGLRVGEALGLTWECVDLEAGSLRVRQTLHEMAGQAKRLAEVKTRRSRRTVELSPATVGVLRSQKARQNEERLLAGDLWQDWGLVFCWEDGAPLSRWLAYGHLKRALPRAKIDRLTVHELRHTAATLALEDGLPIKKVSEMLGHASIAITLESYGHVLPSMHRMVADRMDTLIVAGDWEPEPIKREEA